MIRSIHVRFALVALATCLSAAARNVHGVTLLPFETSGGVRLSLVDFPTYGDRVAAPIQNGFRYGGAADTPNIVCDFGPSMSGWPSLYGDLSNVIYTGAADGILRVTLTADPGFLAVLHSFDLAGWPETDYTLRSVKVFGSGQGLFLASNVLVQGDATGPRHTTMSFAPIVSRGIDIQIDASNLPEPWVAENLGLDNLRFAQAAVPEPSSFYTALVAVVGLVSWFWRRGCRPGGRSHIRVDQRSVAAIE